MDLENQATIKRLVEEHGAENLMVVLGATEAEGLELAAETVTAGDPSYAGPLAGVSLRLPVYHILEPAVTEGLPAELVEEKLGMMAMVADVGRISEVLARRRQALMSA